MKNSKIKKDIEAKTDFEVADSTLPTWANDEKYAGWHSVSTEILNSISVFDSPAKNFERLRDAYKRLFGYFQKRGRYLSGDDTFPLLAFVLSVSSACMDMPYVLFFLRQTPQYNRTLFVTSYYASILSGVV